LDKYRLIEQEGLLNTAHHTGYAGSGSLAFVSDLPQKTGAELNESWVWMESQETETFSPAMFEELFLPAMAKIAECFGLTYYGCCEHLHDRMDRVLKYIPRIRAVSVSPWSDVNKMAEILDGKMVYSRKLNPVHICDAPMWDELEKDVRNVLRAVDGSPVEFIYRDVYSWNDAKKFQECMKKIRNLIN
jgi:hypothetical protein